MERGTSVDLGLYLCSECFGANRESVLRASKVSGCSERVIVAWKTYGEGHVDAWHFVVWLVIVVLTSGVFPLPGEVLVVAVVVIGLVGGDRALILRIMRGSLKAMLSFSSTVA